MMQSKQTVRLIDLCGPWQLAWTEHPAPDLCSRTTAEQAGLNFYACTVPGNFELDLFELGKLPDPFFGMNPVTVSRATERCHVFYTRTFDVADSPDRELTGTPATPVDGTLAATSTVGRSDSAAASEGGMLPWLVFQGLDCFADVYLNGTWLASFDNMLIEQEVPVAGKLLAGANEIFIHIRPAFDEAMKFDYPQLVSSHVTGYESIYVRKAPHMYGWDIMPRFLSAGLYRPVYLEYRPEERIEDVFLKTIEIAADQSQAQLLLHYKLDCQMRGEYTLRLVMTCGDSQASAETRLSFITGKMVLAVNQPRLWWPKGRGPANLYQVEVTLLKNGRAIDVRHFTHGIRTVELQRTALTSSTGEGEFVFKINGEKVFIKGTNWVPVDAFHSRDRERIPAILAMVNDVNCNMIRCWGGNVYEDDLFYEICDQSGILIWQDFTMACSVYPQDDDFAGKIAAEAAVVIRRLRQHPCIALWSGDNECDWSYLWGHTHTDPNTNVLTRKVLPEAVRIHDGSRPYIGSSPFFDVGTLEKGIDYLPEMHLWGPRDYFKSRFYLSSLCHFVSEIGYHGCPSPESIRKFISQDKIWPFQDNDEWLLHSTSPVPEAHAYDYRVELMRKQIAELFTEVPDNLSDFALASQIVQAEAKKFFIELFRMAKWRRTGIIWWNIMDGWPQFSDAVVDYYFAKKLAYFFIRKSQQDVCVMLNEPESWNQKVVVSNDTRTDCHLSCQIRDIDTDEIIFSADCLAPADRSTEIGQIPYIRNRQRFFVITWQGDVTGSNHYLAGQPPFSLEQIQSWLRQSGLYEVTV